MPPSNSGLLSLYSHHKSFGSDKKSLRDIRYQWESRAGNYSD